MQPDVFTGDWPGNSVGQIGVVFGFVQESDRGHHDHISSFIESLNFEKMTNPETKVESRMQEVRPDYWR